MIHPFRRPPTLALLIVALAAGLIWGLVIGRELGPAQPATAAPTATAVATPTGEFVIEPGGRFQPELEPPPPGAEPPADPRLSVRVDIRDGQTGRPVRGNVWMSLYIGDTREDQLVLENTSLVEVRLPPGDAAEAVFISVIAQGYEPWSIGVRRLVKPPMCLSQGTYAQIKPPAIGQLISTCGAYTRHYQRRRTERRS